MSAVAQCAQDETVCYICKHLLRLSRHVLLNPWRRQLSDTLQSTWRQRSI